MEFNDFVGQVKKELKNPLPGELAQLMMSPLGRATQNQARKLIPNPIQSAVLILLFEEDGEPATILMERNTYNGHHSGQISFPGGKVEDKDLNFQETALREFEEEIGVPSRYVNVLGELSNLLIPPSGFEVNPFVASSSHSIVPNPDPIEVANVLTVKLSELFHSKSKTIQSVLTSKQNTRIKAPSYLVKKKVVWGATAMILSELEVIYKRCKI